MLQPAKRRISVYSTNLLLLLLLPFTTAAQDTVNIPLRIGFGVALYTPVSALAGDYPRGVEATASYDLDERFSLSADGGFSRFVHNSYNYRYENSGFYFRGGADYNLLNPLMSEGRYFAGISLKYGLSLYNHKVPYIEYDNYWGAHTSSAGSKFTTGHFLEIAPSIKVELFQNLFIGWSLDTRLLLWSGADKHLRSVDIPGFGNGSKPFSTGINYYISFRIPYRTKRVIYIKKEREVDDDAGEQTIPPPL